MYAACKLVKIESMHRLAEFELHIIGDINNRVNATQAAAAQTLLHPQRCDRARIDIFDHAPDITRTSLRCFQNNFYSSTRLCRYPAKPGSFQFCVRKRRHLARDSGNAQAVATIGRELNLERRIVERE